MKGSPRIGVGLSARAGTAEDRRDEFARLAGPELSPSFRLAARILGDAHEAEDAVSEAVLRAWDGFEGLRDRDRFGPWLARIVVNVCRNSLARRRVVRIGPLGDLEPQAADPFEGGLARDAVGRAIDRLSPDQRIAIVLRYWNDLSVDEIARLTGVPSGTVKWRLHAACRRLRAELAQAGWEKSQ
jgi:RNA polymerase sigma-70 factor (ECF subfamily)